MNRRFARLLAGLIGVAVGAAAHAQQEGSPPPEHGGHAAAAQEESRLDPRDAEVLERIRAALAKGRRDIAREDLRVVVDGLGTMEEGSQASRLPSLLALDRVAAELGSLPEQLRLREAVVAIRSRLLAFDHPGCSP